MSADMEPAVERLERLIQGFFWVLPNLGIAFLVFLLFIAAAWAAQRSVSSLLRRRHRGDLGLLLGGSAKWATILLGLLVVATIVFPSVRPADVLATLGIGSVAIGFAFRDILQNWLAGVLILYRQPFRRGDQIKSGEFEGEVEHVEARATFIRTYDGQSVVIPNSDIYTRAITVRTAFEYRRSEYDVGIGYGDDASRACAVILRALSGARSVVAAPPPEAVPWALDPSAVVIRVFWWTDPRRSEVVRARGEVISAIKRALTEAGIDLPFPTRVVLLHDQTEEVDGDRTRQREGWPPGTTPPPQPHEPESGYRNKSQRAEANARSQNDARDG